MLELCETKLDQEFLDKGGRPVRVNDLVKFNSAAGICMARVVEADFLGNFVHVVTADNDAPVILSTSDISAKNVVSLTANGDDRSMIFEP